MFSKTNNQCLSCKSKVAQKICSKLSWPGYPTGHTATRTSSRTKPFIKSTNLHARDALAARSMSFDSLCPRFFFLMPPLLLPLPTFFFFTLPSLLPLPALFPFPQPPDQPVTRYLLSRHSMVPGS